MASNLPGTAWDPEDMGIGPMTSGESVQFLDFVSRTLLWV